MQNCFFHTFLHTDFIQRSIIEIFFTISTRQQSSDIVRREHVIELISQSLRKSIDSQESISALYNTFIELKKASLSLSEIAQETALLTNQIKSNCASLSELESWINDYTIIQETEVW